MAPLTADTLLALAPELKVELRDKGVCISATGASRFETGRAGLTVLELFAEPKTLAQAMAELAKRGSDPTVWMQVSATVYRLWDAGILRDANRLDSIPPPPAASSLAQSAVHTQVRMLEDQTRTGAFLRAIRATVKPGDVVLDIGTGTGVLAIAAAQGGAKRVYAMEMTGMADVAERMFAANGVADRVTLLRGRSSDLALPEKANVLVTEIIGDGPLGEGVLETVSDARRRLLAPDARIIPQSMAIGVVALRLPQSLLERYVFTRKSSARWNQHYGIDFRAAEDAGDADALTTYRLRTAEYASCGLLSKPAVLARIHFAEVVRAQLKACASITIDEAGPLHGVATYFDLEVGAGEKLSTAPPGSQPTVISPDNHWRIPLSLRQRAVEVRRGERFEVQFSYSGGSARLSLTRSGS